MKKCDGECCCSGKKHGMGKFFLGALVGGSLALLFTPNTGSENRKILKKKFNELKNYVKDLDIEEVKENLEQKMDDLRKDIEALDKETVLRLAKKHGEKATKKATELYEYAKEKTTPVVATMTKEIKDKTVNVAKEVIDKLETEENEKENKAKSNKKTVKKSSKGTK